MRDTISRQKLLRKMQRVATKAWKMNLTAKVETVWNQAIDFVKQAPSADDCTGCRHQGQWENEYEMGYPSPCTGCRRRAKDNYERME